MPKSAVENTFNRLLAFNDRPDRRDIQALEDFILHYLCRKCGEYDLRMKFHTGIHGGNGNIITNSRAALMANLFMKYPKTGFDVFHISYPYQEELAVLAKNFPNVTVDFCWMWIINPSTARRALSDMLDAIPANKIHGFGGDYVFVEGTIESFFAIVPSNHLNTDSLKKSFSFLFLYFYSILDLPLFPSILNNICS